MLINKLNKIVQEERQKGTPNFVIKNILKEYLQFPVLSFIYSNAKYKEMIFTGGSCLRVCFDFPRLSEDLDFDLTKKDWKNFEIQKLADDLQKYFKNDFLIDIQIKTQGGRRIYLKFPILKELGIADNSASDLLYVKIEPNESGFIKEETEIQSISKYGYNFIIRRYSLSYLFTGKLKAIFLREWFSGQANAVDIKGRDFYDLYWYLEKRVSPNYKELKKEIDIENDKQLFEKIRQRINKDVTTDKLTYDLRNFFPEQNFVKDFCRNYKKIIFSELKKYEL